MIGTGMAGIDDMLGGGIPRGSKVLYSMEPGVDGQLFIISTLFEALNKDRSCLVIIPHTTVDAFLHDAEKMRGTSLAIAGKKCVFIDAVDRERIQRLALNPESAEREWRLRISKLGEENQVDVIFAYFDVIYDDFGLEKGFALVKSGTGTRKPTIILEYLNFEGDTLLKKFIDILAFDMIISIKSAFGLVPRFNFFSLVHTSWSPSTVRRSVPFIISEGRIVPYIPKIVVTGPPQSGKSTFVTNASELGLSVDRPGSHGDTTTVAMDFGWLYWKDFNITLYGTPGEPRFDPMLPILLKNAMGVVLMIDATKPAQLARARQLIETISEHRMPIVVAANKKDLPGKMPESEIRTALKIKTDVPVFFVSSTNKEEVRFVLESLVDSITQFSY